MKQLISEIQACTICAEFLPHPPRPVVSFSRDSKILIVGQAPGQKVHDSGIPWNDQSGKELRRWLDVGTEAFYDTKNFGIVPMGFCFPGTGKSGDLPPRPECARHWHDRVMKQLKNIKLIILVGAYAQRHYLKGAEEFTLTENVKMFRDHLPKYFPLAHPSPRNKIWQKRNPWFESELIPELRKMVKSILLT